MNQSATAPLVFGPLTVLPEHRRRDRRSRREWMPARVVLDLDNTDNPPHGEQGSADHGSFHQSKDHPLLVFNDETGQFITAIEK
jgi:hypothetical protein